VRDIVHAVLQDLDFVGLLGQGIRTDTDFTLTGGGNFVVMDLHHQAHFGHRIAHGGAQVVQGVHRRDGEVAALDPGAMAAVAGREVVLGSPCGFFGHDLVKGPAHAGAPLHFVEDEKLGLGPEQHRIRNAGRTHVFLRAVGDGTRIAVVALHREGLEDIAADDDSRIIGERVQNRGVVVGHQHHVGLVDAFPAGDRRAVEHLATLEEAVVDLGGGERNVVLLALGIRETQIDPARVTFFDQLQRL
jgi:hypothetical protein